MNDEEEEFSLTQGEKAGKPWFAIIRQQFKRFKAGSDLPWLLEIHVHAEATDIGLISDEEAEVLNNVEDFIGKKLQHVAITFFVARITWNGVRSLFFYVSDPKPVADELNKLIEQGQYPREFEYKIEKDTDWMKMSEFIPNIESI